MDVAEQEVVRPATTRRLLALTLTALVPVLILGYSLAGYATALRDPAGQAWPLWGGRALLALAGLFTAGGGFVLWHLAARVARTAETVAGAADLDRALSAQAGEVGARMISFTRMLATIEQQAGDVKEFAQRLDTAYKELESTNARLKEFSFKDEVTGLYNRRFFSIRLEEEVSRYRRFKHPVSVVLLDLDGFKAVNDELGHAAGDDTLRAVGELLLGNSRDLNVICRYGGDEFAVLLVETPKAGAHVYADRIRRLLGAHPFGHGRRITASFGIASIPEDVHPAAADLIQAADEALYAAKRGGRDRVALLEGGTARFDPAGADAGGFPQADGGRGEIPVLTLVDPARPVPEAPERLAPPRPREAEARNALPTGGRGRGRSLQALVERRPAAAPSGLAITLDALEDADRATLEMLVSAIAMRDFATHAHSRRVHSYSVALARAWGLPAREIGDIAHGVLLHDIGKIGIPDSILLKPGPLTPEEWQIMRTHPELGRRLLQGVPFLRGAVPVVYHHHERWDGTGYPLALKGDSIPLGARIFAVADAFDAMTFDRPYSRAISFAAAREEIQRCAGTHFDPAVVDAFRAVPLEVLAEILRRSAARGGAARSGMPRSPGGQG